MHATVLLVRGYHHCGASLSEQYIADLMFCHGTQLGLLLLVVPKRTWQAQLHLTKQYRLSYMLTVISPGKEDTMATHKLGLNFTMKS